MTETLSFFLTSGRLADFLLLFFYSYQLLDYRQSLGRLLHLYDILLQPCLAVQIINSETGSLGRSIDSLDNKSSIIISTTAAVFSKLCPESTKRAPMTLSNTSPRAFGGSCFHPFATISSNEVSSRRGMYLLIATLSSTLFTRRIL
jgi:hypothetical protein